MDLATPVEHALSNIVSNFLIRDLQGFDVDVPNNVGNCGLIYPCPNFDKNPRVFEELNKCSSKAIEDFNNKHVSVSFCVFLRPPNSSIIASLLGPLIRYYWCSNLFVILQNTNYQFMRVVKVGSQAVSGYNHYITFEAKAQAAAPMYFQALVYAGIRKDPKVIFCRCKPEC